MNLNFCHNKHTKTNEVITDMISKLYFSRTQQNYLKQYGNTNHYSQQLVSIMQQTSKKKLNHIVEQTKNNNSVFRKYLQRKKIVKLTPQDVLQYENRVLQQNKRNFKNINFKNDAYSKQLDQDIIRIGFMMILEKLKNEKINNLIIESKYIKENIQRQNQNLFRLGYAYEGVCHQDRVINFMQEVSIQQAKRGKFELFNQKIREQSITLHDVANYLKVSIES